MLPPSDHDMLVEIYAVVPRLVKILDDNGRPGLVSRVTTLEANEEARDREEIVYRENRTNGIFREGNLISIFMAAVSLVGTSFALLHH